MAKRTKSWAEKFSVRTRPEIEITSKPFAGIPAGSRLLISTPADIAEAVRAIPRGKFQSLSDFRNELAKRNDADATCPLTASIFLRIVSELALEELAAGREIADITPFWRVVDPKSPLAQKLSCGAEGVARLRALET